jgi:hypothetical protein
MNFSAPWIAHDDGNCLRGLLTCHPTGACSAPSLQQGIERADPLPVAEAGPGGCLPPKGRDLAIASERTHCAPVSVIRPNASLHVEVLARNAGCTSLPSLPSGPKAEGMAGGEIFLSAGDGQFPLATGRLRSTVGVPFAVAGDLRAVEEPQPGRANRACVGLVGPAPGAHPAGRRLPQPIRPPRLPRSRAGRPPHRSTRLHPRPLSPGPTPLSPQSPSCCDSAPPTAAAPP